MKLFKEFRDFINKGNVVDMAVGVVIATAFSKITSSLVADIIMPLLSTVTGGIDFSDKKIVLSPAIPATDTSAEISEVAIRYGMFLQYVIDFLLVALAVFIFIKVLTSAGNKAKELREKNKAKETEEPKAAEPSNEEKLLTEIRDLLKEKK